jgi:ketosteroid isomerase-like protein
MDGPAAAIIRQFGEVEADQRYTRLVGSFTGDAVYYDPFVGAQRGIAAITEFLGHMERVVPKLGVRFDEWEVAGDTTCGWARWTMYLPGPSGDDVAIPGQSIYRLRDGKVCFAADHLDPVAYRRARPEGTAPDHATVMGLSAGMGGQGGPALDLVHRFWALQEHRRYGELASLFADDAVFTDLVYGRFEGAEAIGAYLARMQQEMPSLGVWFEHVDAAGDENVAWSQWWCHFPNGKVPGWTLHTVRDGRFTLDADYFDTAVARAVQAG